MMNLSMRIVYLSIYIILMTTGVMASIVDLGLSRYWMVGIITGPICFIALVVAVYRLVGILRNE